MDPAALVKLILSGGVMLVVVSIGMRARPADALLLVRNPALGARAMLAMFVLVPAFVLLITAVLPIERPMRAALLALAISPMPPILAKKEIKAGGAADYAVGLQVLASVVSIAVLPAMVALLSVVFKQPLPFSAGAVAATLLVSVGAPLVAGLLIGQFLGSRRDLVATWAGRLGTLAMVVGVVVVLFVTWPRLGALISSDGLFAAAAMVGFGLAAGHFLGGPGNANRGALAVASAARHPGVAIALASGVFPAEKPAIIGAVLIYLLVNAVVTLPYMKWRGRMPAL